MLKRIKQLSQDLANQIAAGEVVERPASVIKELVENSIDAGSTKIEIETEMGGRRLMRVIDNGHGIHESDVELAFSRHATSKLEKFDDIETVGTLGFRGEALASISSVSRLKLVTQTEDQEFAVEVTKEGDESVHVTAASRPVGTTIEVRDLFFNTPARRKFLRSQPTENFHIASIVTHYALANPSIAFKLTNNGREKFSLSAARGLKERAYQLFGKDLIESLLPVLSREDSFVRVSGFVSAPKERRTSKDSQYLFINGRFVKDKVVSAGISEGFRSVLPHGVYPVAFLFVELPHEEVDVNVHPSKTEVRFRRAEAIKEEIAVAIRESLAGAGIGEKRAAGMPSDKIEESFLPPTTPNQEQPEVPEKPSVQTTFDTFSPGRSNETKTDAQSFEPDFGAFPDLDSDQVSVQSPSPSTPADYATLPPVDDALGATREITLSEIDESSIKPIGQLHRSFIIAADKEGLLLIDQHVAHERILFDQFRSREYNRNADPQRLLIPETIDLSPGQLEVFSAIEELVKEFGFEIAAMSGRTIAVKAVPADLSKNDSANLVRELIESVENLNREGAEMAIRDDIAATLACKAAVKINMDLSSEKMQWMVDRLLITDSPSTCPHGRPVVLRLRMKDIERKFHRT